mmetsp:Transcript_23221/g.42738  ORF Transcript_23221/g.42738 Transcript_23221/m.42738 type:complete len:598 (+) Transcript_23221:70-1863(+)
MTLLQTCLCWVSLHLLAFAPGTQGTTTFTTTVMNASSVSRIIVTDEEEAEFLKFSDLFHWVFGDALATLAHEKAFAANKREVDQFNSEGGHTYTQGLNEFAAFTWEEFTEYLGILPITDEDLQTLQAALASLGGTQPVTERRQLSELPSSWTWEGKGVVTPVKNQQEFGQKACGSCYAFAAVAAVESAWKIAGGPLVDLSEQDIVDCAAGTKMPPALSTLRAQGCVGGWAPVALEYMKQEGLCSESSYPYIASATECKAQHCSEYIPPGKITYQQIPTGSVTGMMAALVKSPVSTHVGASPKWQRYTSGVFQIKDCFARPNHAVLAVGYGKDEATGTPYWVIKNSHSAKWGESGYQRLERPTSETVQLGTDCWVTTLSYIAVVDYSMPPAPPVTPAPTPAPTTTTTTTTNTDCESNPMGWSLNLWGVERTEPSLLSRAVRWGFSKVFGTSQDCVVVDSESSSRRLHGVHGRRLTTTLTGHGGIRKGETNDELHKDCANTELVELICSRLGLGPTECGANVTCDLFTTTTEMPWGMPWWAWFLTCCAICSICGFFCLPLLAGPALMGGKKKKSKGTPSTEVVYEVVDVPDTQPGVVAY